MSLSALQTALFFGTDTTNTEEMSGKISEELVKYHCHSLVKDIAHVDCLDEWLAFDLLILGIPTWDFGGIQEEWEDLEDEIKALDLSGKLVALFGLGDQFGYSDYFVDAMGWLYDLVIECGATVIGEWPAEGYDFDASRAAYENNTMFRGLALDEDQQIELSDERIEAWIAQLARQVNDAKV